MSRVTGETVVVRPTNNVYTVLAVVGVLAQALGIIAIVMKATEVGGLF
ncbi:MAG TPA: hypothetical protein VF669_03490 [Tepidisphaeraceae bacterium]|jgi:hypothetical protein